jgi:ATP adenylyltransferase
MKRLYAPWRGKYTTKVVNEIPEKISEKDCIFCKQLKENNDDNYFILHRFKHMVVMLNFYPYNAGHIMILPLQHVPDLNDLSVEARAELMELTNHAVEIVKRELNAHGVNVGINLGKAAGAGLPSHLHVHVLPRWRGDANFLPLLAGTKPISVDLHEMYAKLKPHFTKLKV